MLLSRQQLLSGFFISKKKIEFFERKVSADWLRRKSGYLCPKESKEVLKKDRHGRMPQLNSDERWRLELGNRPCSAAKRKILQASWPSA